MRSNLERINEFLQWAKKSYEKEKLSLDGFWTYDNEFFSWDYLKWLISERMIVINREMGNGTTIETGEGFEVELKKVQADVNAAPWYYKGEGKIFTEDVLKGKFKAESDLDVLKRFPLTLKILDDSYQSKEEGYFVHADWSGKYFLILAALSGESLQERVFSTDDLFGLRDFIIKERPRGVVLSYVPSDGECPIYDIDLSSLIDLFCIPEMKYFKLLFVEKGKTIERKNDHPEFRRINDGEVTWVLAYSK